MSQEDSEFAELVHLSVVVNKDEKRNLKNVAKALGMSYDTFYSRLRDDKPTKFTAAQIKALIKATEDIRLVDFFLEGTTFITAERANFSKIASSHESLRQSAGRTVTEAADILREVERSLSDNKFCHQDKVRITKEICDAERALAALRSHIQL